jgi:SAM-dependent methyltransferase
VTSFPDPERLEYETVHALIKFRGAKVLEIGTGDGRTILHYAREAAQVIGVDVDRYELELAREDYLKNIDNVHLAEAGAERLPFPDFSFDLVVLSWSLCCVATTGTMQALREAVRVSRETILDIRATLPPPLVWVRNRSGQDINCGPVSRKTESEHNLTANEAVAQAIRDGWLTVTASRQFDWVDVYESGDELVGEVSDEWENWYIGEDLSIKLARALSDAGRGAVPFITQGVQAQVLKKH